MSALYLSLIHIFFDDVSTGATSDLQHATDIARKMVTEYGMSDTLGPVYLSDNGHEVFLGRDFSPQHKYSEAVAAKIDKEMRDILEQGYAKAEEVINANRDRLERIVSALIEHEKLDRAMFEALWVGELLPSGDQSGEEELVDQAPEAGELPNAEEDKACLLYTSQSPMRCATQGCNGHEHGICRKRFIEAEGMAVQTGAASLPQSGQEVCGDSYAFQQLADGNYLMTLSDGMGLSLIHICGSITVRNLMSLGSPPTLWWDLMTWALPTPLSTTSG